MRLPHVDQELLALLGWNAVPGLGARRLQRILKAAGSAAAAAREPARWRSAGGRGTPRLPDAAALRALGEAQAAAAAQVGAVALGQHAEAYPRRLRPPAPPGEDPPPVDPEKPLGGYQPPPLVFVIGDVAALADDRRTLGIVGARACTAYGREQAARFATGFADAGWTVVSGAARGIDQAAMRGAVRAGGRVVAVLGSPLDRIYPSDAGELLRAVLEQGGAVVSEFPFGAATRPGNFPRRNRVLAAASELLLVVQASCRSGTMSTCRATMDLGRDVWAVPGDVDCPVSAGCHALILDGAGMALSPAAMLDALERRLPPALRGLEDPLLLALRGGRRSAAELAVHLDRAPAAVAEELLDLELRGLVGRSLGGLYHRSGPDNDEDSRTDPS